MEGNSVERLFRKEKKKKKFIRIGLVTQEIKQEAILDQKKE